MHIYRLDAEEDSEQERDSDGEVARRDAGQKQIRYSLYRV